MRLHSYILLSPLVALMRNSSEKLVGKGVTAAYIQNIHEDELMVKTKVDEFHDGKAHISSDSTNVRIPTLVRLGGFAG